MRSATPVLALLGLLAIGSVVPASAAAPPRTTRLISGGVSSTATLSVTSGAMAKDGSRIVFSTTEALLPTDLNTVRDVYARDSDGTLQLISGGAALGTAASVNGVSADGDRVWYSTADADLPSDGDTSGDIYERRRNGDRRQISAGNGAVAANFKEASDDGDHVLWFTIEAVPGAGDGDAQTDYYDRRGDGSFRLVTPGTALTPQTFSSRQALSSDGARFVFFTNEALTAGDLDAAQDSYSVPTAGGPYTLETPGTVDAVFAQGNEGGDRAWFTSDSALVPADVDTATDVYERHADGTLRLISGGTANAAANIDNATDDGSQVIFHTTEALLPADVNGQLDFYDRRADGSLHLVSGGTTGAGSSFTGLDDAGSITFSTDQALDPADVDGSIDLYLRTKAGAVMLLTPGTPVDYLILAYVENIPADLPRTTFVGNDLPGTGDTNGQGDLYEVTPDGVRRVGPDVPAGTGLSLFSQGPHGSRITFSTVSTVPGTGDSDTSGDIYESAFAVPVLSGVPTMTGNGRAGSTQRCSTLAVTGEAVTLSTAWLRDGVVIAGAKASSYKPTTADAGHRLSCRVIADNGAGIDTADSSSRRVPPAAKASKLAGFPIVGTRMTCTSFAGATRTSYRWKRGSSTVRGRTSRTFKVGGADLGKRLTCTATARNGALSTTVSQKVTVPRRCTVLSVRGLTPAAAKAKLGNAGCRSKTKRITGSGVAVGLALGTSPARGAKRANGATITINLRR